MQDDVSLQGTLFLVFPYPLPYRAHTAFAPTRCLVDIRLCLKWLRTQPHTLTHTHMTSGLAYMIRMYVCCMCVCMCVCLYNTSKIIYLYIYASASATACRDHMPHIVIHRVCASHVSVCVRECVRTCVCACAFHNCLLILWRQRKRKSKWHILNLQAIDLYKKQRKYKRNVTFG